EELGGDEGARTAAEAGARMRGRADVPHAVDRRPMWGTPEEVLVEREGAAVRVAVHEVHIRRPEVCRREDGARENRRLEVRGVLRDSRLDAVCVPLPQV